MTFYKKINRFIRDFVGSILNSYSQIFFSNNWIFALILIIVSFIDFFAGISGIIAVSFSSIICYTIGFNKQNIKAGYYGFNSLLVALGLGVFYAPSSEFYLILFFATVLTVFLTLTLEGIIGKYGLPFLSLPFLFGLWAVILATRKFEALEISERGIYMLNDVYYLGGGRLLKLYNWFNQINLHESLIMYFKSLGAIFFQYHLFAGILIAIGLLLASRISFLLSIFGFYCAYLFYHLVGASLADLSYSYIGFNYILTAIAIGGFFIVPSWSSYLWVVLLTPIIAFVNVSSSTVLGMFQLGTYSLPFNFVVIIFLYILKFRDRFYSIPELVNVQHFSPEKNLYSTRNFKYRFPEKSGIPISLPFWGKWVVSQAHDGEITHKNDWKHAWDFEIIDDDGSKYNGSGTKLTDYYCYNKPVIAPADGYVVEIIDNIPDNKIGETNLDDNWGNAIVVKHNEKLFTKISHIKKESFKVNKGDFVKRGDILAYCGNSGRSPIPHIHFQVQETPYVGSKTIDYPISNYVLHDIDDRFEFNGFSRPKKEQVISNIEPNEILKSAYKFVPGQNLILNVNEKETVEWQVKADFFVNTYLYCSTSESKAWFKTNSNIHYFTGYQGSRNSLLYHFYLASYIVPIGFYKNITIHDRYPVGTINNRLLSFIQDLIAPFWIFVKANYQLKYIKKKEQFNKGLVWMEASSSLKIGFGKTKKYLYEIQVSEQGFESFVVKQNNKTIIAQEIREK